MRRLIAVLAAAWAAAAVPALAPAQDGPSLGGGSDVGGGEVVGLGQGQRVGPIHYIFADNPEATPIGVEFRAETPPGISVTPDRRAFTIPPGGKATARFSIEVSEAVAPGSYPILVSLVRTDVVSSAGRVTNVPAIGARFAVRVTGQAGTIQARTVDPAGAPVEGTIVVAAELDGGRSFEVARVEGSQLERAVAPGRYEVRLLLGDSERAAETVTVAADAVTAVTLTVETVSFVVAEARPVEEDGKVVVAELLAAVQNAFEPVEGPITLRAVVRREGGPAETVELEQLDRLPLGSTEARLTYRPAAGWDPGTYRVVFELVTPELTLRRAASTPIEVSESGGGRLTLISAGAILAALAALMLVLVARRARTGSD